MKNLKAHKHFPLHTERQKEVSQAARADAEAIDAELEEYSVEIFAEDSNESEAAGDNPSAVYVILDFMFYSFYLLIIHSKIHNPILLLLQTGAGGAV